MPFPSTSRRVSAHAYREGTRGTSNRPTRSISNRRRREGRFFPSAYFSFFFFLFYLEKKFSISHFRHDWGSRSVREILLSLECFGRSRKLSTLLETPREEIVGIVEKFFYSREITPRAFVQSERKN